MTIVVPSVGRPTLGRTLLSCEGADEILVGLNRDDDYGYRARNRLTARATGDVVAYLDDDDVYLPGAIDAFRAAAEAHPGRVLLFKMRYGAAGDGTGYVLWHEKVVRHGAFGTPCIVVPNLPGRLGTWRPHAGPGSGAGDYAFAAETITNLGPPVWIDREVALIRP